MAVGRTLRNIASANIEKPRSRWGRRAELLLAEIARVKATVRLRGTTFWARKVETLKMGGGTSSQGPAKPTGNNWQWTRVLSFEGNDQQESVMPVLVMWAVPAVIVIGGVGYWLVHMH
jgi:hypothetical protein